MESEQEMKGTDILKEQVKALKPSRRRARSVSRSPSTDSSEGKAVGKSKSKSKSKSRALSTEKKKKKAKKKKGKKSNRKRDRSTSPAKKQPVQLSKHLHGDDEKFSVITGSKIKLKVDKSKADKEDDAKRRKLLDFLNSSYE